MTSISVWDSRSLKARLAIRVIVSLVAGTFAFFLTEFVRDPNDQSQIWSLTMSVFVGGVVLVVQFLVDFERRAVRAERASEDHTARTEQMVQDGFAKINEVTELVSLVEASALKTDKVLQLLRQSTRIDSQSPPLLFRFAQEEIDRMSDFLRCLGDGGPATYEGEDRDWLLTLARQADLSIEATSLTSVDAGGRGYVDGGLWTSDLGQRYLRIQREAMERGVRIRRLFVIHGRTEQAAEDVLSVCLPQQEMGIEVRVLDPADIPPMRREPLFDFVLFDQAISYETTPTPEPEASARPTILNTKLELNPERVSSRIKRFEELWELAREVDR